MLATVVAAVDVVVECSPLSGLLLSHLLQVEVRVLHFPISYQSIEKCQYFLSYNFFHKFTDYLISIFERKKVLLIRIFLLSCTN